MDVFLTSSPCPFPGGTFQGPGVNPANGFIDALRESWPTTGAKFLTVAADPDDVSSTEYMAYGLSGAFDDSGLPVSEVRILDTRSEGQVDELLNWADVVLLGGGHVPTQNAFFARIGLARALAQFDGIVIGVSAGSMNCARTVYAMPEEPGEATDPSYQKFLPGLGLTDVSIIPHRGLLLETTVDGLPSIEGIAVPDSMGREFILIPDGSYVLVRNGVKEIRGEAWRVSDGTICRFQ